MDTLKKNDFSHYEILSRRYELRECLAVASVGLLYRARDLQAASATTQHKPNVFVHVLPEDFASSIAMASQLQQQNRKLREAVLPHILTVREFGRDREKVFAVLDYPDARLHVLDSQQMNNEPGLVPQIVEGLSCLHRYDLMHGGLEAQVFLVSDQSTVYLWGTGVMPVMCRNQSSRCMEDSPYLSPERYLGVEPRRRDDIYALGVQLYYWKAGRWPYQSSNAVRARENGEEPIPVSELGESHEFSEGQWSLLKPALALDASQRPAHISELANVYEPVSRHKLPWWQWGMAASVLVVALGLLYFFMQSDVRSTFAEPAPRQVAIPAEVAKNIRPVTSESAPVATVIPETVPEPVSNPVVAVQQGSVVSASAQEVPEPEAPVKPEQVVDEPPAVEPVVLVPETTPADSQPDAVSLPEPVKLYLQDAPVEEAVDVLPEEKPEETPPVVAAQAAVPEAPPAPQQQTRPLAQVAPSESESEPAAVQTASAEPRITWSGQRRANANPPQRPATDALASLEQDLIYGGESIYPPHPASEVTAVTAAAAVPQRQAAEPPSPSAGSAVRDLRGIPLSRWTAHELSLRANQALREGRLDEEANRGAVYFIRHLKRFHRGHSDIKRLAGGVVSALHKRAQAQLGGKQKLQMGRTLFFTKKFIREFNLVGYNAVQEKLEHEQYDLPRPR